MGRNCGNGRRVMSSRRCGLGSARGLVLLVSVLACLWISPGCAPEGEFRLTYLRGATPSPLIKATQAGTYDLMPEGGISPKFSIELAVGDKYGFRQREDDAILAVAKDKEIELGDRFVPSYYWVLRKPAQDSK